MLKQPNKYRGADTSYSIPLRFKLYAIAGLTAVAALLGAINYSREPVSKVDLNGDGAADARVTSIGDTTYIYGNLNGDEFPDFALKRLGEETEIYLGLGNGKYIRQAELEKTRGKCLERITEQELFKGPVVEL